MCPKGYIVFLKFDLRKVNASGLTYKDDGQILSSKSEMDIL